jgi:EAL domain-containing protein (putative c-di-GMP-specific phosphodiesterase class I)
LHVPGGMGEVMDFESMAPPAGGRKKRDTLRFEAPKTDKVREKVLELRARASVEVEWMLESRTADGNLLQRTPIQPLPFRVGRGLQLDLVLPSPHVSKNHAEIYSDGEGLRVRDLGSRNGTFLNREAVTDAALHRGDVLHFGDFEFRIMDGEGEVAEALDTVQTLIHRGNLSQQFAVAPEEIYALLKKRAVTMVFQPIVELPSRRVVACEALGRGRHPGLPESPVELFEIAGMIGPEVQAELSRLFRRKAVEIVRDRPEVPVVFLNTHGVELERPGLVESLEELRAFAPQVDLVLEIHETALAQADYILWLRNRLKEINVGLAYDDFGTGQARLFELAEAPPDYLKFDLCFIKGIDQAPTSRQRLVASLVAAARELRAQTVAEGVETAEEAAACQHAGFSHAQGYYYGRPGPVEYVNAT